MASQHDKYQFNVIGGPNKFDLMVSLFEGNPKHRKTVAFKLEGFRQDINVAITSVEQEDGSGESWNITGWVMGEPSAHVRAYYSSHGRSGFFTFITPTRVSLEGGTRTETVDVAEDKKLSDKLDRLRENLGKDFSDLIQNARRM